MPKVSKSIRDAILELREYRDSLAPQRGFFSTLDKLVEDAPFARGSADEWRGYLKPGRTYEREGVKFPLKQEELDYALNPAFEADLARFNHESLSKEDLLELVRHHRPSFGLHLGSEEFSSASRDRKSASGRIAELEKSLNDIGDSTRMTLGGERYGPNSDFDDEGMRMSHTSPFSTYEESSTTMGGYEYPKNHLGADTVSHSRTSSHEVPDVGGGTARLVEEIQSDPHQDAAARLPISRTEIQHQMTPEEREVYDGLLYRGEEHPGVTTNDIEDAVRARQPRRGYTDDRDKVAPYAAQSGYQVLDAPFKTAAEYGRLELRKQLLNAVRNGDRYLALTNPEDQIARYSLTGKEAAAMHHIYGKVYRSEMEKLAKQYGANVKEIELSVGQMRDVRPMTMREGGFETIDDYLEEMIRDNSNTTPAWGAVQELIDDLEPGSPPLAKQLRGWVQDMARMHETGKWDDVSPGSVRFNAEERLRENLQYLYDQYASKAHVTGQTAGNAKTFPAIELTPEVREKIKRAGVPLWSAAGAGSLLEMGRDLPSDDGEDRARFAEGGLVDEDETQRLLDRLDPEVRDHHLLDRLGEAFTEQWSGLGEKGDIRGFNPDDWASAGVGGTVWDADPHRDMRTEEVPTPGIYRDTVSLPAQFGYSGRGSEYMEDQLADQEALHTAAMDEAGLDEPYGFLEHGASAMGTMMAQPMIPAGGVAEGAAKTASWMRRAKKILGAPIEWLSPTVGPSAGNYLIGAGFGAAQEAIPEHIQRAKAGNRMRAEIENMSPERRAKWDALVEEMEDHLRSSRAK